jgi:hypothetical protein
LFWTFTSHHRRECLGEGVEEEDGYRRPAKNQPGSLVPHGTPPSPQAPITSGASRVTAGRARRFLLLAGLQTANEGTASQIGQGGDTSGQGEVSVLDRSATAARLPYGHHAQAQAREQALEGRQGHVPRFSESIEVRVDSCLRRPQVTRKLRLRRGRIYSGFQRGKHLFGKH